MIVSLEMLPRRAMNGRPTSLSCSVAAEEGLAHEFILLASQGGFIEFLWICFARLAQSVCVKIARNPSHRSFVKLLYLSWPTWNFAYVSDVSNSWPHKNYTPQDRFYRDKTCDHRSVDVEVSQSGHFQTRLSVPTTAILRTGTAICWL